MAIELGDWQLLRETRLLANLNDGTFSDLVGVAKIQHLKSDTVLFREGEPAQTFYIVMEGWITLYRSRPNGQQFIVQLFGRGESFAEALINAGATYPVSARAVSIGRVAAFDTAEFRTIIARDPRTALSLIASCYQQMHQLIIQLEHVKTWSARKRVAEFLLRISKTDQSGTFVVLPLEKRLIAARLGMTPETLSRTLRQLSGVGVVVGEDQIELTDLERLSEFVRSNTSA